MSDEKMLTVKEVAKQLRVSNNTVIRLIESGVISPTYRVGTQYRIPQSTLDSYLRKASQ